MYAYRVTINQLRCWLWMVIATLFTPALTMDSLLAGTWPLATMIALTAPVTVIKWTAWWLLASQSSRAESTIPSRKLTRWPNPLPAPTSNYLRNLAVSLVRASLSLYHVKKRYLVFFLSLFRSFILAVQIYGMSVIQSNCVPPSQGCNINSYCFYLYMTYIDGYFGFQIVVIENGRIIGSLSVGFEPSCASINGDHPDVAVGGSTDHKVARLIDIFLVMNRVIRTPQSWFN